MANGERVAVTGLGFASALGIDPHLAMKRGESGVAYHPNLDRLPHSRAARVGRLDLRPWLKRRKDKKLMARPSQLALSAAGHALQSWDGPTDDLGLYLGVGREPGDDGESEPALVAAQVNGQLDENAVAGRCRDLYPPLLPLKTLPNMALAHISIHLDVRGENGAWSGGAAAGLTALRAAIWSIRESRCEAALVVAADSWVSVGAVRDRLRMSDTGSIESPGEAGVALLVESMASAARRKTPVFARLDTNRNGPDIVPLGAHYAALGCCQAADGLLAAALRIAMGDAGGWVMAQDPGQPPVGVGIDLDGVDACYAPASEGGLHV